MGTDIQEGKQKHMQRSKDTHLPLMVTTTFITRVTCWIRLPSVEDQQLCREQGTAGSGSHNRGYTLYLQYMRLLANHVAKQIEIDFN